MNKNRIIWIISLVIITSILLASCAPQVVVETQVVRETQVVVETQVVESTTVVEKIVEVTPTQAPTLRL
jgi:hypothetical protein